jgi:mono/diheme cytochrome c family protein
MSQRRLQVILAAAAVLIAGCTQKMAQQPAYRPFAGSDFFADGTSARPLPPDTVARGQLNADVALATGKNADGTDTTEFPITVTRAVLEGGRSRFQAYCTPCHGYAGDGDGMVVQRGFSPPPTFHSDRLRSAPVGHFVDVMSNGLGPMPSYASQVSAIDRWAIAAYIRALQLSQNARLDDVPPDERGQLAQP